MHKWRVAFTVEVPAWDEQSACDAALIELRKSRGRNTAQRLTDEPPVGGWVLIDGLEWAKDESMAIRIDSMRPLAQGQGPPVNRWTVFADGSTDGLAGLVRRAQEAERAPDPRPGRTYPARCQPVLEQGEVVGIPLPGAPGLVGVFVGGQLVALVQPIHETRENPEPDREPMVVSRVQAELIDTLPDGVRYGLGMVCNDGPILVRMVYEGGWLLVRDGTTWCEALHVMATAQTWEEALTRLQEGTEDETKESS